MEMRKFVKYHLPAILYGILIIALSTVAYLKAPRISHFELDKLIHFAEYAVFAALIFRSFSNLTPKIGRGKALIMSFAFLIFFALGDEFCQKFVPGRDASAIDFLYDLLGLTIMLILIWRSGKTVPEKKREERLCR
jgi:VanZ family protein